MTLSKDPLNLIITGVGGQGTLLASRLLGEAARKTPPLALVLDDLAVQVEEIVTAK